MYSIVEFPSQGATLRGRYYLPNTDSRPLPIVIMTHGFSATINGMVADRYADVFVGAGLAVLLYDHRNLGISDGEPRQEINRWIQTRGYFDAIDFVSSLSEIDGSRIGIWGDSASGAEAIIAGAVDQRIKAVVVQVPACGRNTAPPDPDGSLFEAIRETVLHGDVSATPETTTGPMPVVSFDQSGTPSLLEPITAFRWFIEYGGRYGTYWENRATVVSPKTSAPHHPGICAPHLKAPLLMMMSPDDEMPGAESHVSRMVFEAAPEPKQLVEVEGGHFGLLHYPSKLFDEASGLQAEFLVKHLMNTELS